MYTGMSELTYMYTLKKLFLYTPKVKHCTVVLVIELLYNIKSELFKKDFLDRHWEYIN